MRRKAGVVHWGHKKRPHRDKKGVGGHFIFRLSGLNRAVLFDDNMMVVK